MAKLTEVFSDKERTNWLKAWLAVDIAKSGLQQFADTEAHNVHMRIYSTVRPSSHASALCTSCHIANLLKCPTTGICNKRGTHGTCTSMHDTPTKLCRRCPSSMCDKVRDEIIREHRYAKPSWRNTSAQTWATTPWEIAKCYFPPDGYDDKRSIQDTDFNGVISFLLNCKHFDGKFSFRIEPSDPHCLLTKTRDICKAIRHPSLLKVTDADLQDYFTTLTVLLGDPNCLAHDSSAQDAVRNLTELQNDKFNITEEIIRMLNAAEDMLKNSEKVAEKSKNEMREYIEKVQKENDDRSAKCLNQLDKHADKHKRDLNEHIDQRVKVIDEHIDTRVKELNEQADTCKDAQKEESIYQEACEELRQGLAQLYNGKFSHVPTSPLNENVDERLIDIYTAPNLQLMSKDNGVFKTKGKQVKKYKEMFLTDGKVNRRIFIQGEAGSGKSTFTAKLVMDWCGKSKKNSEFFDDLSAVQNYKFVFLITLRDSVKQYDIAKMIKEQIIDSIYSEDDREKGYRLLNEIMKREMCLVVLDGLDEWTGHDGKHALPSLVSSYRQCVLLLTVRPWKLAETTITNSQIDILLQLEGINEPFELSRKILSCRDDCKGSDELNKKQSAFESYIRQHDLNKLLSSPMMLSLIVRLWAEGTDLKGSLCEIYSLLLESLLKKANSQNEPFQQPPFRCFTDTQYIQPNIGLVQRLSEAAFYLLFSHNREHSIVFSIKELKQYELDQEGRKEFALKAGIISETKQPFAARASSTFSFIHKSVQEFLAAYYISNHIDVIYGVIFPYLKRHANAYLEISEVFIFLCGLNISAADKLSSIMNDCAKYHGRFQKIILAGYREALANKQQDIHISLSYFYFDVDDIVDLHNIWMMNTVHAKSLYITGESILRDYNLSIRSKDSSSAHCQEPEFMRLRASIQPCQSARSKQDLVPSSASCIEFDLSSCPNLEELTLLVSVTVLPNILKYQNKLKLLTLSCKCVGLDLSQFPNLEQLYLIGPVTVLPNSLKSVTKLKGLTLWCKCDKLDLSQCPNLEELNLRGLVTVLPNTLTYLPKLKRLKLSCECDGLDLSPCPNLKELDLCEPVTVLPNTLKYLTKLKRLTLSCTCGGLDLSQCPYLKKLDLQEPVTVLPNTLRYQTKFTLRGWNCERLNTDNS